MTSTGCRLPILAEGTDAGAIINLRDAQRRSDLSRPRRYGAGATRAYQRSASWDSGCGSPMRSNPNNATPNCTHNLLPINQIIAILVIQNPHYATRISRIITIHSFSKLQTNYSLGIILLLLWIMLLQLLCK